MTVSLTKRRYEAGPTPLRRDAPFAPAGMRTRARISGEREAYPLNMLLNTVWRMPPFR
jgi:hypothetical protein